ncbi:MAG: NADH-quinone oxidoreductase subunit NuoN [Magnetococcales bacterium]|nr:NADH-quinone oxidoreductase subunit NuoN [Magnetococcales bacterium]
MSVSMPAIQLSLLFPEIIVAVAAMTLLLMSAWSSEHDDRSRIAILVVLAVFLAGTVALLDGVAATKAATTFSGLFVTDRLSSFLKVLMALATLLPLLLSWDYLKQHRLDEGEYFVLTLCALLGGMIIASSGDFMVLYLGIELMSLSVYVLAAYRRDDLASNEAGLKYFILGSMASGLMLYGMSLIYGTTGSTLFSQVHQVLASGHGVGPLLHAGIILVLAGLSFKIAAAPFHMWAPDVYQGAPTSVTAFMSVMPKIAGFAAFYRVLIDAFAPLHHQWGPVLQLIAIVSMVVGSLAAIAQTDLKRMLAYSSIGHAGYALVGLAAGTPLGYQSVLIYLAIYLFMNVGTFAVVLVLSRAGIGEKIDDYRGLAQHKPLLAFLMALFMFSMAGIPPLAGFIGKFQIFMAAVQAGLIPLAIIGVLTSAVGAFYYLRIVKLIYFDPATDERAVTVTPLSRLVLLVTTAVVLVWGILPGSLIGWAEYSVKMLSRHG